MSYPILRRMGSLSCPVCQDNIRLIFGEREIEECSVGITLKEYPILQCPRCKYERFPNGLTKFIEAKLDEARSQGIIHCSLAFKDRKARYHFAENIRFTYDYRDYICIPGLVRPLKDGFLTPVFFRRRLLDKYIARKEYKVQMASDTYGTIYFPDRSYISFGINRGGEIIAWLGDIAKLPEDEQHYFKSENIPSSHDIASEFYDGQIGCIFTDYSAEAALFRARAKFLDSSSILTGGSIHRLGKEANQLIDVYPFPLDGETKSYIKAFSSLHKICVETIIEKAILGDLKARGGMCQQK